METKEIEKTSLSSPFDMDTELKEEDKINDKGKETPKPTDDSPEEDDSPDAPKEPIDKGDEGKTRDKKPDKKEPIKGSDFYKVGQYWKEEGYIPEDVELDEDISADKLENIYRSNIEERVAQEKRQEIEDELKRQGFNEKDLETARLINNGIDPNTVIRKDDYSQMANYELPEDEVDREKDAQYLLQRFYEDKGFSESKTDKLVKDAFRDDTVEDDLEEAQEYFGAKAKKIKDRNEKIAEEKEKARKKAQKKRVQSMKNYIDKCQVGDTEYSEEEMKEVEEALFDKTETVETDEGTYRVTKYDKMRHEIQNDDDKMMNWIVQFILGLDKNKIKDEVERETRSNILSGLGNSNTKDSKPKNSDDGIKRKALF